MSLGLAVAGTLAGPASSASAASAVRGVHRAAVAPAAASQLKAVNWTGGNVMDGDVYYVNGFTPSDTFATAYDTATQIFTQFESVVGANAVRLPINEATVLGETDSSEPASDTASNWAAYQGVIDAVLDSGGSVILTYFPLPGNGQPASMSRFYQMWDAVTSAYGSIGNVYFEVMNEPWAYGDSGSVPSGYPWSSFPPLSALTSVYQSWLARYSSTVPRGQVILDGSGWAMNGSFVGGDSAFNGTLIGIHDYSWFTGSFPQGPNWSNSETGWGDQFAAEVGAYASRTVVTEWGIPEIQKIGSTYYPIDYSIPSGSVNADFFRGVGTRLHSMGVKGSAFWMGLSSGGPFWDLTTKTVDPTTGKITLSIVNNTSVLPWLQYAWGGGTKPDFYTRVVSVANGLFVDGQALKADGASAYQVADDDSYDQQWTIVQDGFHVRIRNATTGLYLDGFGFTADGSVVGQWSDTNSTNQQWIVTDAPGNSTALQIKNLGTGLCLDTYAASTSGSLLKQTTCSAADVNQQWRIAHPETAT